MDPQKIIAFVFGVSFVVALGILAIKFPSPTQFQYIIFRIILALAAAGVAAMMLGSITVEGNLAKGLVIHAGGPLAIFVIVYFFNPGRLVTKTVTPSNQIAGPRSEQVAAVCYRQAGPSPDVLLVKTTGGRWTFPKGNVETGEENWLAAQREAFEEAGANGVIEHEPFTTYLHQKKEWKGEGIEFKVHAFLLKVEKTQAPESKRRKPTWFSIAEAEQALAEDRQFKYAEEFRRVLREAAKRLT